MLKAPRGWSCGVSFFGMQEAKLRAGGVFVGDCCSAVLHLSAISYIDRYAAELMT